MTASLSRWRTVASATAVAATLLLSGCFEQTAPQLVEAGKAKMDKREYKAAAIEFKNALQRDTSLVEARFLLGKALLESGDVPGAWVELNKAREVGYDNDELVPVMAGALILKGDTDKFLAEYADVELRSKPRQAELKAALATAYGIKGKFVQARAAADAALEADPGNIVAQLAVAQLLLIAGDAQGAMAQTERALNAHPESARPWVTKAEILQATGQDLGLIMTAYREAIKRSSDNLQARLGLIMSLLRQRDLQAVDKELAELKKQQPGGPHVLYYSALLAFERNDLKTAHETALQLLKFAADNPNFLHLAGLIEFERGSYLQAIAHLGKAVQTPAAPIGVRILLARSQLRAGDARKALAALQPLLDAPVAPPPEVYGVAADAKLQLGDTAAARKYSLLAVKANPGDLRSRTVVALADMNEGRTEQAMAELKSMASADAGVAAEIVMFIGHLRAGEFDKAVAVTEAIEKKQPKGPTASFFRARIEQLRGHADKARELYELANQRDPSYLPAVAALADFDARAGKFDVAAARYEKFLTVDPRSVEAQMAVIVMRARAGAKPADMDALLDAAIKRFPDAEGPRVAMVGWMIERGEAKRAVQFANENIARLPDSAKFQEALGLAELAASNHNQSLQAFAKMAALQPNSVDPLMRLVQAHLARRDNPAAIGQLQKALAMKPNYVPAHSLLVSLLARAGKTDEALAQAKSLQTQVPNEATGWTLEGDLLAARANRAPAVAAYRASLKKQSSSETAAKLHRALLSAGQTAEAAKFEATWLETNKLDPVFLLYLGDLAMAQPDFDRAEGLYRKVLAATPNNALALNNLAWLLHKAGKPAALETAEKALAAAPNSAAVLDTVAEIHAAAGRIDKALSLQKRAVEVEPDQPQHRLHYARYLVQNGQKAEARAELQRLSQSGKGMAQQEEVQKLLSQL
jgi:cellulose synthase operon protein C